MDWDKVSAELQKPLNPDAIKPPPQGKYGEYVDGLHVVREANRIFGEGGWSYSITRLDMVSRIECKDRGGNPQVRIGYACTVRVDVGGAWREGAAVGMDAGKPENEANVHESAYKEAETDALKRALRTFGNTFGLALYEKDRSKREVGYVAEEPELSKDQLERNHLCNGLKKQTAVDALQNVWGHADFVKKLDALPEPMRLEVTKTYNDMYSKLGGQQ